MIDRKMQACEEAKNSEEEKEIAPDVDIENSADNNEVLKSFEIQDSALLESSRNN